MSRAQQLDQLYTLLDHLRSRLDGGRLLQDATAEDRWPTRGVYFFFEPGETRADGHTPRVVRVGTHGVARTQGTAFWQRLAQHRGHLGGGHPGGGNHRGSIFRHHVGGALIRRGDFAPDLLHIWSDSKPRNREQTKALEYPIEQAVSAQIRAMPLLWVDVPDAVSRESHRKVIERGAIALLSHAGKAPIDPPSPTWLGRWAPHPAIAASGLWNVQHVTDPPEPGFLDLLAEYVRTTALPGVPSR